MFSICVELHVTNKSPYKLLRTSTTYIGYQRIDINSSLTIIKAYANCSGRDLNVQIILIIVQNKTDVHLFVKKRISELDY